VEGGDVSGATEGEKECWLVGEISFFDVRRGSV